jgi:glycosyltransferase involved in cell wall biosynthesis
VKGTTAQIDAPLAQQAPLVSVIIVTRNRRDELLQALRSCAAQDYPWREIIVFDDASDEPLPDAIRQQFPHVEFHRVPQRSGPTALRDAGLRQARGAYVVSLDDDAYFSSSGTLREIVEAFAGHPDLGALALPLVEPMRNPQGSMPVRPHAENGAIVERLGSFLGGSVALRRSAVLAVGGVRACFRYLGGDEGDLAIRMLEQGYEIGLLRCPPVIHTVSPVRDAAFKFRYDVRSALLFVCLNAPLPYVVPQLAGRAVKLLVYRITWRNCLARLAAVVGGLGACVRCLGLRQPVSAATYQKHRSLPHHGVLPWSRDSRHWYSAPQEQESGR